ncbi:protein of unknown function [Pseudomonas sp. JV551A1]|nr:protein of unknown function [Pseudomonas sp. JV551A1]
MQVPEEKFPRLLYPPYSAGRGLQGLDQNILFARTIPSFEFSFFADRAALCFAMSPCSATALLRRTGELR